MSPKSPPLLRQKDWTGCTCASHWISLNITIGRSIGYFTDPSQTPRSIHEKRRSAISADCFKRCSMISLTLWEMSDSGHLVGCGAVKRALLIFVDYVLTRSSTWILRFQAWDKLRFFLWAQLRHNWSTTHFAIYRNGLRLNSGEDEFFISHSRQPFNSRFSSLQRNY